MFLLWSAGRWMRAEIHATKLVKPMLLSRASGILDGAKKKNLVASKARSGHPPDLPLELRKANLEGCSGSGPITSTGNGVSVASTKRLIVGKKFQPAGSLLSLTNGGNSERAHVGPDSMLMVTC